MKTEDILLLAVGGFVLLKLLGKSKKTARPAGNGNPGGTDSWGCLLGFGGSILGGDWGGGSSGCCGGSSKSGDDDCCCDDCDN